MRNLFQKKTAQKDEEAATTPTTNAWEADEVERLEDTASVTVEKLQVGVPEGDSSPTQPASPSSPVQSKSPVEETVGTSPTRSTNASPTEAPLATEGPRQKPSKGRFLLRLWQMFAAIGTFGFQYGATPYSNRPFPFTTSAGLLYYVYAISCFSFIWSLFMIYVYLTRRFGRGGKIMRPVAFVVDIALAAAFGVGVFYEIAKYQCKPGTVDGWCNFFNTGLFFAASLFVSYVVQGLWDFFGGLSCLRR